MFLVLLSCLLWIQNAAFATFLPDQDIKPSALAILGPSNTTEEKFKAVINKVQSIYAPIVKNHGGILSVSGNWKSETPNAYARQLFGMWSVELSGALARRPELSTDGMTLILCHELGHHLGGFAMKKNAPLPIPTWAASEGQADYFATHVCLKKLWQDEVETNFSIAEGAREDMYRSCAKSWAGHREMALCLRTLMASESVAITLAALKGETKLPKFTTPDTRIVKKTDTNHPATQCRLDTYFQGALCTATYNDDLIPGKKVRGGAFSVNAEKEAALVSCTQLSQHRVGLRPTCWFKARF